MPTLQTRRHFALFGVAGIAVAASLAAAAMTLSAQKVEFQTYKDMPMPFAMKNTNKLLGSSMTIGLHNDIPVDEVFFTTQEIAQVIQDGTHEDRLFLVRTPIDAMAAHSMAAAFGYAADDMTKAPEVYLYVYSDKNATLERLAQEAINNGETRTVAEQFPNNFLAMGDASMAAMEAFAAQNGVSYDTMNMMLLPPDALMLVIVNDTNVSFQIRCGNNVTESPEECDDGDSLNIDTCTNACIFAACQDSFLQPLGADGIDTNPNGNSDDEECDDGNPTPSDGCSSTCQVEFCGDFITQAGGTMNEQCDNGRSCVGGLFHGDTCDTQGTQTQCVQSGGTCQPVSGDGCSDQCLNELVSSSSSISSSVSSSIISSSASSSSSLSSSASSSSSSSSLGYCCMGGECIESAGCSLTLAQCTLACGDTFPPTSSSFSSSSSSSSAGPLSSISSSSSSSAIPPAMGSRASSLASSCSGKFCNPGQ